MTRTRSAATEPHPPRALPPIAAEVDRALCELDDQLDWLRALSPVDSHGMWIAFRDSGYRQVPEYRYPELPFDPRRLRRRVLDLPVEDVENKELEALLWEKQRELDRQVELIELRGTSGFLQASIDLWGDAEAELVTEAEHILAVLDPRVAPTSGSAPAGYREVIAEAERHVDVYRQRDPTFATRVHLVEDLSAKLMVSRGDLYVARDIEVAADQVPSLIHHEVGTHALTRHNGTHQPLTQLKTGLAHYHSLQEGLGVLSEYLSGHLAPSRAQVLAARVIATRDICAGCSVGEIFQCLVDAHGLAPAESFNIALRVGRGGGMTKDAAYLRGLRDLVAYLANGNDLVPLFVGKLALPHLPALEHLSKAGLVVPPRLMPSYVDTEEARKRIERCRHSSLLEIVSEEIHA